jgi:hypothetical protein
MSIGEGGHKKKYIGGGKAGERCGRDITVRSLP